MTQISNTKLNISIIGTGAIGGFYGIMLAQLGHHLHFLLHSDYAYVKAHGLTLQSDVYGEININNANFYHEANEMPVSDIVIVALKTTQNKEVLPKVIPYIADEHSTVILIQNGLGMEEELATWFPHLQIAGATALIGSNKAKPGLIVHESYGSIDFGSYNLKDTAILDRIVSELNAIQIPASHGNLKKLRWKKLIWNMTFNGLSVVLNANTDRLLSDHLDLVKALMQEVINTAAADEVILPPTYIDALIPFTEKMGSYTPSMHHDYLNKRPLEIEYMYNNPLKRAATLGVEMPEMEALYNSLLSKVE